MQIHTVLGNTMNSCDELKLLSVWHVEDIQNQYLE